MTWAFACFIKLNITLDFNTCLEIVIFGDAHLLQPVSLGSSLRMLSHLDVSPTVFDCFDIYF